MTNRGIFFYGFFGLIIALFCASGAVFANTTVPTTIHILPPSYELSYDPPHSSGSYTTGFVYVSITGQGILPNISGIQANGTYNFPFYRGTGPFITGAAYSSGNTWVLLNTSTTINRIDNTFPTFAGVINGNTYAAPVTITFSDNVPGVTATLNGNPFINGTTISTNGTYQLIVTDIVGNQTGATFIVYITTTPPPAGGGAGIPSLAIRTLTKAFCEQRSCYSYYYEDICGPCLLTGTEVHLPNTWPPYHYTNPITPDITTSTYPKERNDAYQRAYRLGITTAPSIKEANMEGMLYRKIAAKMASEFAIKAVGLVPDDTRVCEFKDIDKEIPELQYYIKLACKLGIMGVDYYGDPDTVFNPNYFVTRDQLATILSRILFKNDYNLKHEEVSFFDKVRNFTVHTINSITTALGLNLTINTPLDWYTKHLEAIKKLGIMTNYTITLKEFKGYVMIIMYRIDQIGLKAIQELVK